MAQAQVLCQRLSDNGLSFVQASHSQPPLSAICSFDTSANFQNIDNAIADYSMSQPLLHSQYAPEVPAQAQRWSSQRNLIPKYETDVAATIDNAPNGLIPQQGRLYNGLDWNNVMTVDQYSVLESNNAFCQNQGLMYNSMAAQNMVDKNFGGYLGLQSWAPSGSSQGLHGVKVSESDVDTRSSLSPKSYFSDQISSETTSYTPGQMSDHTSPLDTYGGYHTSFRSIEESPSVDASSRYQLAIRNAQESTVADCATLPRVDPSTMASRVPSAKSDFNNSVQIMSYQDNRQCGLDFSALRVDHTSSPSWHFRGYADDVSGLPLRLQHVQHVSTFPNTFSSHGSGRTQEEVASLDRSRAVALAQDRHADRSQAPRIVDKDIRRKLVGEKPAESTLRGRYRALTKDRKDRVRKPIWTRKDVFRPLYVHFGNSTCKRKWLEVNADASR